MNDLSDAIRKILAAARKTAERWAIAAEKRARALAEDEQ